MSLSRTEIAALAQELHQYHRQNDFSVPLEIKEVAYRQVVDGGNIRFTSQAAAIKKAIMKSMTSTETVTGKDLVRIGKGLDFSWSLYEQCVNICEQNNLNVMRHTSVPAKPNTVSDALEWFNMTELKAMLKEKGQPVGGNRADLEARMLEKITISDIQKPLTTKYQEKTAKMQEKALEVKYNYLMRFIKDRAYFLQSISTNPNNSRFEPELMFLNNEEDDRLLAKALDGTGFDTVIIDGEFCKLLPLFPGSSASHKLRYRRGSRSAQGREEQQPKSKLESILGFFKRN